MTDNSAPTEQPAATVPAAGQSTPDSAAVTSPITAESLAAPGSEKFNTTGQYGSNTHYNNTNKPYYSNNHNKTYTRQNYNNANAVPGNANVTGGNNRQYQKKPYNANQAANNQPGGNTQGATQPGGKYQQQQNYNNYGAYQQPGVYGYPYGINQYGYPIPTMGQYGIPQQYPTMQPSPKVRLSTKDGKVVDLEEKKRAAAAAASTSSSSAHSSISSPVSTPTATTASPAHTTVPPITAPAVSVPVHAAVPMSDEVKEAIANKPVSAAEEFKRRIREKAEAALKAKKAEEKPKVVQKVEPKVESVKEETKPVPVKVEQPAEVEPVKEVAKPEIKAEAPKAEILKIDEPKVEVSKVLEPEVVPSKSEEPKVEEPKSEEPKVVEPKVEETKVEETKVEETKVEESKIEESKTVESKIEEPKTEETKTEEPVEVESASTEKITEPATSESSEASKTTDETTETTEATAEDDEPEEEEEEEEEEDTNKFTISKFLDRLNAAAPIEDIYSTVYPEGISGASSERRLEGKKYRYDPQFLVQFQDLVSFPLDSAFKSQVGIIDINIQPKRTGPPQGGNGPHSGSNPRNKFGGAPPRFGGPQRGTQFNETRQNSRSGSKRKGVSGGSSRDKSTRKGNQSKRGGRDYRDNEREGDEYNEGEITIPLEEIKPLVKSATRWTPKKKTEEVKYAPDGSILLSAEDVHRKVKSLLNKLTLEMFGEITDELVAIANQTRFEEDLTTIQTILSLTFAKATDEPHWCKMYASFCAKLISTVSDEIKDKNVEDTPEKKAPQGGALARRILLTTCQTEYEKGWVDKLPTNEDGTPLEPEMMSDEYYAMAAAKRRGLGLVEFIGHLYNAHLLNDSVIYVCIKDSCKQEVSEENLENFTKLLKTVGPNMDADERKRAALKVAFNRIDEVLEGDYDISSRSKFMLMDLKELRNRGWRSNKADDGPKTLTEIHRDAEIQKMEEQRASNERRQKRHTDSGSRSNSTRGPSGWNNNNNNSSGHSGHSGNSNQGSNSIRKNHSFANRDQANSSSRDQRTGSGPSSSSPGIQRDSSKRTESSTNNRFAYLADDNDGGA